MTPHTPAPKNSTETGPQFLSNLDSVVVVKEFWCRSVLTNAKSHCSFFWKFCVFHHSVKSSLEAQHNLLRFRKQPTLLSQACEAYLWHGYSYFSHPETQTLCRSASTRQSTNVEVFRRACGQVPCPPFPFSKSAPTLRTERKSPRESRPTNTEGFPVDFASQMRSRRIGWGNPGFGHPEISDIVDPLPPAVGTSHLKSRDHTFEN